MTDMFSNVVRLNTNPKPKADGQPEPELKRYCIDFIVDGQRFSGMWWTGTEEDIEKRVQGLRSAFEDHDIMISIEEGGKDETF
jgi:hypothetical protein